MTTTVLGQASLSAFTLQETETAIEFHNWPKYRECLVMWFPSPWYTSIIQHYTRDSGTTGHGVPFSKGHIYNTTLHLRLRNKWSWGSLLHGTHLQYNTTPKAQEQVVTRFPSQWDTSTPQHYTWGSGTTGHGVPIPMGNVYNTTLHPRFWKSGGRGGIVMRIRTSGVDNVFYTWEGSCTREISIILSPKQYPNKYNIKV